MVVSPPWGQVPYEAQFRDQDADLVQSRWPLWPPQVSWGLAADAQALVEKRPSLWLSRMSLGLLCFFVRCFF